MKKYLRIISIVSGVIGLFLMLYDALLKLVLKFSLGRSISGEAASIAIIGGADGPTAIYIASKNPEIFRYGVAILLLLVSVISNALIRKNKNGN